MAEVLPSSATSQPAAASPMLQLKHGGGLFHELLSDLNPLQYIPVVGTIYRAVTGDQGNPTLRFAASLGTSFALGGPIGIAVTAGEKLAGIDPERMVLNAAKHLFHLGHAEAAPATTAAPGAPASPPQPNGDERAFAFNTRAMSADDLNGLELRRLEQHQFS